MSKREEPRVCALPGCGRELTSKNRTGVCRAHNHAAGFCYCVQCAGLKGRTVVKTAEQLRSEGLLGKESVAPQRQSVARASPFVVRSPAGMRPAPAAVTLPVLPWEAGS